MGFTHSIGSVNKNKMNHDIRLNDLRFRLEALGVVKAWKPEHVLRSEILSARRQLGTREVNIPDALVTLQIRGKMVTAPLELELTLKGRRRYEKTLDEYRTNKNIGFLWYVVPTARMGQAILKIWQNLKWNEQTEKLYWSTVDELLAGDPKLMALHQGEKIVPLSALVQMNLNAGSAQTEVVANPPAHTVAHGVSTEDSDTSLEHNSKSSKSKDFAYYRELAMFEEED